MADHDKRDFHVVGQRELSSTFSPLSIVYDLLGSPIRKMGQMRSAPSSVLRPVQRQAQHVTQLA